MLIQVDSFLNLGFECLLISNFEITPLFLPSKFQTNVFHFLETRKFFPKWALGCGMKAKSPPPHDSPVTSSQNLASFMAPTYYLWFLELRLFPIISNLGLLSFHSWQPPTTSGTKTFYKNLESRPIETFSFMNSWTYRQLALAHLQNTFLPKGI